MEGKSRKIFLVTSEFPPAPGGIGNHAYNLAKSLQMRSMQVTVITDNLGASSATVAEFDAAQRFKTIRVNRTMPWLYVMRIWKAVRWVASNKPDMILVSGKFSLWIGGILKLLGMGPVACVLHGSEVQPSNGVVRRLTHASLRRFDKIVAVSSFTNNLVPAFIRASTPCIIIPNGIDLAETETVASDPVPELRGHPVLLTVGNVTNRKGQHRVIRALPLLRSTFPQIHYYCIGLATLKGKFEALASSLGVSHQVTFLGKVESRASLFKCMQQATVFIMLSENQHDGDVEGFGIAILEANAMGVPAIGAKGCGIEDAIHSGVNGFLVNGADPNEVLKALEMILKNYSDFSFQAKQWAREHAWNSVIDTYVSFLFDVR